MEFREPENTMSEWIFAPCTDEDIEAEGENVNK